MNSPKQRSGFGMSVPGWRAWAGLVVAPVAWGFHHQLGSNMSYAACDRGPDTVALTAGLIALLVIGTAGWLGWQSWKSAGGVEVEEADALEVFIPLLSIMAAALFALTIFVQLLADLILPSCFS
jgi:hypothetical protein